MPSPETTPDFDPDRPVFSAVCGVDGSHWLAQMVDDTPPAGGSFCPDCRARKMIAPGVLHWRKQVEVAPA